MDKRTPRSPSRPMPKDPSAPGEAQDTQSPLHDDWLLDEALNETFPASDPISPSAGKDKD